MKLQMGENEILRDYRTAKNKNEMIRILADQNLMKSNEMAQWLADHGMEVDKRMLHKAVPRKKNEKEEQAEVIEETEVKEEKAAPAAKKPDQTAKSDAGKPKLTLVPFLIVFVIARIREYGNKKYPDRGKDNWKDVEPERHFEACLRHMMSAADDMKKRDMESGLPHLWHAACDLAFVIAQLWTGEKI